MEDNNRLNVKSFLLFCFSAKHRTSGHPSWTLCRKGGGGCRGRLRHLHGHPFWKADWQLLVCGAGNPDRTKEVGTLFFHSPLVKETSPTNGLIRQGRGANVKLSSLQELTELATIICLSPNLLIFLAFLAVRRGLKTSKSSSQHGL